jgi:hypothetical protein
MLRKFITALGLAQFCLRSWRVRHPIVLLESDDWGVVRTSSAQAHDRLKAAGYAMDRSLYGLDALETDEDMRMLLEVLDGVRDYRGRPACMTANVVLANPDFPRIRQGGFAQYVLEPVDVTFARDGERRGVLELWRQGLARRLFVPQLHAREHVRWWQWLAALRAGSSEALETFDLGMCGVPIAASKENQGFYSPPYLDDESLAEQGVELEPMVRQGAEMFCRLLGYRSVTAVAPNYHWTDHVERIWRQAGVRAVQGAVFQFVGDPKIRRVHYLGQRSGTGLTYLVRNCTFEPAASGVDWLTRCLRQMTIAVRMGIPAIISTHRINYMGSIRPDNRAHGLRMLGRLLREARRRWPNLAFLSSPELAGLIERNIGSADLAGELPIIGWPTPRAGHIDAGAM